MIHPETGEVLETREQLLAAIMDAEERMGYLFNLRRLIREGGEDKLPPAHQPPARSRTPTQDRVARCPRCGSVLQPFMYTKVFETSEEMTDWLRILAEKDEG